MIGALTNHLWQSTLFAVAAGLVAMALRKNGAHIRHRVWLVASLKFLVPFSVLLSLGSALPRFTPAATVATSTAPDISVTVDRIAQPFTSDVFFPSTPATTQAATDWTTIAIVGTWACGFALVALMRLRGWRRIRAAVRASTPLPLVSPVPVRSAPGLLEPGIVGLWRPVLLVPAGIEHHLTPPQFEAVLAHELCHVQRRDNLTSAIHMVVEAAFWFHPLVWWVGARLVDERERACDEHVLRVCGEPRAYAESILNVCKLYVESPIACVSGVSGADLKKRVAAILVNRIGLQLTFARKAALAFAAMLAVTLPLVVGMLIAPLRAQGANANASAFAAAQGAAATADQPTFDVVSPRPNESFSVQTTPPAPKFDVASIKQCAPDSGPAPGQRGASGGPASPGYLYLNCLTLLQLANMSSGHANEPVNYILRNRRADWPDAGFKPVRGGPSWVGTDRFTIEARASGVTDRNILTGPMLRALLEDRFQLKTHQATEDRAVYALKVAAGGLKITPVAPESCYELDPAHIPEPGTTMGKSPCGMQMSRVPFKALGAKIGKTPLAAGTSLSDSLSNMMDRVVIDQTGLDARYNVEFEYTPDETTPRSLEPGRDGGPPPSGSGPNIFKALETLGLKLEPTKWPVEYLVIDHVEKPRPNPPGPIQ